MVAIYARQSVDRPDSVSIETQIQKCKAQLRASELEDCRVYEDRGYSGKDTNRPAMQQLLRDIADGQVQSVFVYKIDRISRSVHDFTGLCNILSQNKVGFHSCEDGITLDDTPAGVAMAQILMVFAQFERETILRRVTDNYYERAKQGMYLGGRPPFGFAKGETTIGGKKTACFVPHEAQGKVVQAIFERYLLPEQSLGTLMRWLNDELGLQTNQGRAWSTVQLGRLIRNPAYVQADVAVYRYLVDKGATMNNPPADYRGKHGCYLYSNRAPKVQDGKKQRRSKFSDLSGAFVTLAPHEGLIDADTWLRAQEKMDANKALKNTGAGKHSWLSGLMKCKRCGYAITVVNKPNVAHGHYINCGGHKKGNAVCPGRSVVMTLEDIEGAVEAVLLPFLQSLVEVQMRVRHPHPVEKNDLELSLYQLEQEIAQLMHNMAQVTQPDVVQLTARALHEKNEARSVLCDRLERLQHHASGAELQAAYEAMLWQWHAYTTEEKKQIARLAIARVIVGDGQIEVILSAQYGNTY